MNKKITLIHPYYNNPGMLKLQQDVWRDYSEEIKQRVEIIVVDDCSPREPAIDVYEEVGMCYRLYRIDVDVRWNWLACRNLAAREAEDSHWLFLTDIDHVVPEKSMYQLLTHESDKGIFYTPSRIRAPEMKAYKPHPNSYFMHRDLYWSIGGYDERFSGMYGSDGMYRRRCEVRSRGHEHLLRCVTILYPREVLPDASTVDYERKTDYDRQERARRKHAIAGSGDFEPKTLTFPWSRIR